jgi:hypothetical protein
MAHHRAESTMPKAATTGGAAVTCRYFNQETTARHIVFAYSLFKAVGKKKMTLIEKSRNP